MYMNKKKRSKDIRRHEEANLYVPKPMRDHLGDLSKLALGSRCKWKKMATAHGLDVSEIKEYMERIIYNNAMKRKELEDVSKKIRSKEATDESNTTQSTDRDSSSDDLRSGEVRSAQLETGDGLQQTVERSDETPDGVE